MERARGSHRGSDPDPAEPAREDARAKRKNRRRRHEDDRGHDTADEDGVSGVVQQPVAVRVELELAARVVRSDRCPDEEGVRDHQEDGSRDSSPVGERREAAGLTLSPDQDASQVGKEEEQQQETGEEEQEPDDLLRLVRILRVVRDDLRIVVVRTACEDD